MLMTATTGSSVTTIEELTTDGVYHPIQQGFSGDARPAMWLCTPGMIPWPPLPPRDNPPTGRRFDMKEAICAAVPATAIVKGGQYATGQRTSSNGGGSMHQQTKPETAEQVRGARPSPARRRRNNPKRLKMEKTKTPAK